MTGSSGELSSNANLVNPSVLVHMRALDVESSR